MDTPAYSLRQKRLVAHTLVDPEHGILLLRYGRYREVGRENSCVLCENYRKILDSHVPRNLHELLQKFLKPLPLRFTLRLRPGVAEVRGVVEQKPPYPAVLELLSQSLVFSLA